MSGIKITGKDILFVAAVYFTAGAAAGVGYTAAAGFTFGFNVAAGASAAALSLAARVYARTQTPPGGQDLGAANAKSQTNVRSTIEPRNILYGEQLVGGSLVYVRWAGATLEMVFCLADHPCDGFSSIKIDDRSIRIDDLSESGYATGSEFGFNFRVKFFDGTQTDPLPEIDDENFIGAGMTYAYVTLTKTADLYPRGIPPIIFLLRGKKVLDVRDGVRKYSVNPALILYDYMTTPTSELAPGLGIAVADIDTDDFIAAANACDQIRGVESPAFTYSESIARESGRGGYYFATRVGVVFPTYRGQPLNLRSDSLDVIKYAIPSIVNGEWVFNIADSFDDAINNIRSADDGTAYEVVQTNQINERKFYGGGVADSSDNRALILEAMVEACAGRLSVVGGKWRFNAGVWIAPAADAIIDEDNMVEPIRVQPKVSTTNRFNIIRGTFSGLEKLGQATAYQSYVEAHNDGREIALSKDFPFIKSQSGVTTVSKIQLRRQKYELLISVSTDMSGMRYRPGDVVRVSNERFGWDEKFFEVQSWTFKTKAQEGVPLTYIEMTLRETNASIFDLSADDFEHRREQKTDLPNPFTVPLPVLGNVLTQQVETTQGDFSLELIVDWSVPNEAFFADSGGNYELEWQLTREGEQDDTWIGGAFVSAAATRGVISQVSPLRDYDVRVRATNSFGVSGAWVERRMIRPTPTATVRWDLRFVDEPVYEVYDTGMITGAVVRTLDLGTLA